MSEKAKIEYEHHDGGIRRIADEEGAPYMAYVSEIVQQTPFGKVRHEVAADEQIDTVIKKKDGPQWVRHLVDMAAIRAVDQVTKKILPAAERATKELVNLQMGARGKPEEIELLAKQLIRAIAYAETLEQKLETWAGTIEGIVSHQTHQDVKIAESKLKRRQLPPYPEHLRMAVGIEFENKLTTMFGNSKQQWWVKESLYNEAVALLRQIYEMD